MSRLALALVRTPVPEHLEGDVADVALFSLRVFCGNVQQVYRQMSLLLHPDKRPAGSGDVDEFTQGFLLLLSPTRSILESHQEAKEARGKPLRALFLRVTLLLLRADDTLSKSCTLAPSEGLFHGHRQAQGQGAANREKTRGKFWPSWAS